MDDYNGKGRLSERFQFDQEAIDTNSQNMKATVAQYYAVAAQDEIIKRFKLNLRTGQIFSIPYAVLPVIILTGNSQIFMKVYNFKITIEGRNLRPVEEALSKETLLWLKESPSGIDNGEAFVFIKDIEIKTKNEEELEEEN